MLGVGTPGSGSARSVGVPGGLLNSSVTACSGVREPIAQTLTDSLSPTTPEQQWRRYCSYGRRGPQLQVAVSAYWMREEQS
jgi:hypothetical protein